MRNKLVSNPTRASLKALEGSVKSVHENGLVGPHRRRSLAAIPSNNDTRADTPSGEQISSPTPMKNKRRSISTVIPPKGILLSPLSEVPTVDLSLISPELDPSSLSSGLLFPLCRRSPTGSTSEDSTSGSDGDSKGLIMRSGGPKSLPPITPGRPRSRSMDNDDAYDPDDINNNPSSDRRRSYSSVSPLFGLTPRDISITTLTSLGSAHFPVSILKNSQERLHKVIAQPSPPRHRKVSFKGLSNPECINDNKTDAANPDNTDSGNEADNEVKNNTGKDNLDEDKGFCTVVHSFTPRPKPKKPVRPPTPVLMNMVQDSDDEDDDDQDLDIKEDSDDDISDEEKTNTFSMSKLKSLEPRHRSQKIGRLSAASSSSSSSSSTISTKSNRRPPFK